jgi:type I restriction enzyme R subunit
MARKKSPELTFQEHIADFLVREHKYAVLEQSEITDTDHCIAEDRLWGFLKAMQTDTLKKLTDDYGSQAPKVKVDPVFAFRSAGANFRA